LNIEINGLLGLDLLMKGGFVIDLKNLNNTSILFTNFSNHAVDIYNDLEYNIEKRSLKEVIVMATISFTKDFTITKRETVDKLEKAINNTKPLNIDSKNVISDLRRSEEKLLSMLRSKA
jgi:hypothetical protein